MLCRAMQGSSRNNDTYTNRQKSAAEYIACSLLARLLLLLLLLPLPPPSATAAAATAATVTPTPTVTSPTPSLALYPFANDADNEQQHPHLAQTIAVSRFVPCTTEKRKKKKRNNSKSSSPPPSSFNPPNQPTHRHGRVTTHCFPAHYSSSCSPGFSFPLTPYIRPCSVIEPCLSARFTISLFFSRVMFSIVLPPLLPRPGSVPPPPPSTCETNLFCLILPPLPPPAPVLAPSTHWRPPSLPAKQQEYTVRCFSTTPSLLLLLQIQTRQPKLLQSRPSKVKKHHIYTMLNTLCLEHHNQPFRISRSPTTPLSPPPLPPSPPTSILSLPKSRRVLALWPIKWLQNKTTRGAWAEQRER